MSVHEPPQFTPSQVLEAGRRAEAEGRGEYAVQFYRHLVDHYPGSGEAAAAQSALSRLSSLGTAGAGSRPIAPPPPLPTSAPMDPRLDLSPPSPPFANPFEAPRPYEQPFQQATSFQPPHHAPTDLHQAPMSGGSPAYYAPRIELPEPPNDYRTGRVLARLFAWLGGLEAFAGLALLGLAFVRPRVVEMLPLFGSGAVAAILLTFAGLFQLMVGQIARAVMDHAIAARDMAAIARAEAEGRHTEARQSQRY